MTRGRMLLFCLVGLALVAGLGAATWWWYLQHRVAPPPNVALCGTSVSTDILGVSGGHLVVERPKPGLYFGTVRTPGSAEQITYLIVFRYGPGGWDNVSQRIHSHAQASGKTGKTADAIALGGQRIEAEYQIELNEGRTGVATESLSIGGERMDLSAGRVFLIDLTAETPVFRQKIVELPAITTRLDKSADLLRFAEAIRTSLDAGDEEIKRFLGGQR
jgi:hypothetical protein